MSRQIYSALMVDIEAAVIIYTHELDFREEEETRQMCLLSQFSNICIKTAIGDLDLYLNPVTRFTTVGGHFSLVPG